MGRIGGKGADGGCGITGAGAIKEEEDEVVEGSQDGRGLSTGNLTGIFTKGDVAAPVQNVFDVPVFADEVEYLVRGSVMGGKAG